MKTQRELNLHYWSEIHDMVDEYNRVHQSDVKPWECVKFEDDKRRFSNHPSFDSDPDRYQFAVAILYDEQAGVNRAIFPGDTIYDKRCGYKLTVIDFHDGSKSIYCGDGKYADLMDMEHISWHKPQPKRTFEINGEVFPCPEEEGAFVMTLYGAGRARFKFNDSQAYEKVYDALVNMLTEARDK